MPVPSWWVREEGQRLQAVLAAGKNLAVWPARGATEDESLYHAQATCTVLLRALDPGYAAEVRWEELPMQASVVLGGLAASSEPIARDLAQPTAVRRIVRLLAASGHGAHCTLRLMCSGHLHPCASSYTMLLPSGRQARRAQVRRAGSAAA
eukprot:COSAG05_NODE_1303_length_5240_cov_2.158335_3_plen_151_part_00